VPRTADGVVVEATELERRIATAEADLNRWLAARPESDRHLVQRLVALPQVTSGGPLLVLGRIFLEWDYRLAWWRERRRMTAGERARARELDGLLRQQRVLRRQVASLALARRMLAAWHAVHIPIGMVLFTAAFVHVGAAIYYASLLK
jgi:hypothetical protein